MHFEKEKYRDLLIQISLLCRETEITTFVNSLDDLNELFVRINPNLNLLFEKAFTETRFCDQIDTLVSDNFDELRVVPSVTSFVDEHSLVKLMRAHKMNSSLKSTKLTESLHKTFVKVRMLKTNWLFNGTEGSEVGDLLKLAQSIEKNAANDETKGTNEFLNAIVETQWSLCKYTIKYYIFIPFLVYALLCQITLPYLLHEYKVDDPWVLYPSKAALYILTVYCGSFEVITLYDKKILYLL